MATRASLMPYSAEPYSTAFAALGLSDTTRQRPVLLFDASTDENIQWTFIAPQGLTGTLTAVLTYIMASATTGNVIMAVSVEAVTDGDTLDLDAADSFDTANTSAATAVPGTAGHIDQLSITLTNADSIAAGDYVRVRVTRDADNASDTATGDLLLLAVELRDAA